MVDIGYLLMIVDCMNKHFFFVVIVFTFFLFPSCSTDSKKAAAILQSAEYVVEQNPDSTLVLLDSIENPYELNQELHAKYMLLLVQSKYKTDKNVSNDTLIFQARDYFKKSKDIKRCVLATFYSGRVLESLQKNQEALNAFLEAESLSIQLEDQSITGFIQYNIGDAFYQNGLYDDAIYKFKQAAENFARHEADYAKEIMSLSYIGNCYSIINKLDSAFFYYNEALSRATVLNDTINRVRALQNMGVAFFKLGKIEDAKEKLIEAQVISKDLTQQAKINLNLAKMYKNTNQLDSATFYISKAIELAQKTEDRALQGSILSLLSEINEKKGNYKASLENYKKYADYLSSVYDERQELNFLDVQRKYNFELMRQANAKLLIEKQRIFILLLISALAIIVLALIVYIRKKRDKEVILLATQEIYQLKKIISNRDLSGNAAETGKNAIGTTNDKLKEVLAEQFGILKRIALLEDTLPKEEKEKGKEVLKRVYKIVYGHFDGYDWDVLINAINNLHDGYADRLQAIAPQLKEADFRICCLSKAGLRNSEIAGLLNMTENAVFLRKTHIRKVIKMQSKRNFVEELDKLVV